MSMDMAPPHAATASPRILVTGATGTVGRHVVHDLTARGVDVVAASRHPASAAEQLGVPAVRLDVFDPSTYDALAGVDRLFLVRPPSVMRVGASIFPLIDAAVAHGVRHVVLLSVLGAGDTPLVPHRWIEDKLRAVDLAWTFLRPSFFLQNLSTTHRDDVRERGEIVVPAGVGRTSFVDARDVAAAGAEALTGDGHDGAVYELTGAEALTYGEVATLFSDVLGRPIRYTDPSIWAFVQHERERGRAWSFILVMTGIYLTARFGLAGRVTDDLARLLGREPRTVRDFVEDYADVWT